MEKKKPGIWDSIEIDKMHDNLANFRKLALWTSMELGDQIGVSRSTIVNFERNTPAIRMSKAQYIALRTVLEARARELVDLYNDNSLETAISLVFYNEAYEENASKIKSALVTAGAAAGVSGSVGATSVLSSLLPALGIVAPLFTTIGLSAGIMAYLKNRDK